MKIAITTPTGHVGRCRGRFPLGFWRRCQREIVGPASRGTPQVQERGAQLAIGAQDDADFLTKATEDVDALFWVTPPGFGSDNVRAFQNRLGKAAATALGANPAVRVVNLSSIGAQLASGVRADQRPARRGGAAR